MTPELKWAIIGTVGTLASIFVAILLGFPTIADWFIKVRERPELHVFAKVANPGAVADGFTYVRLDLAVVNSGNVPASNIPVRLSAPPTVQTTAESYRVRQPTTPGEGDYDLSVITPDAEGIALAAHMLAMPPLHGDSVAAYAAGSAVVYVRSGGHVFRWSAHCVEDHGRAASGTFTVNAANGQVTIEHD